MIASTWSPIPLTCLLTSVMGSVSQASRTAAISCSVVFGGCGRPCMSFLSCRKSVASFPGWPASWLCTVGHSTLSLLRHDNYASKLELSSSHTSTYMSHLSSPVFFCIMLPSKKFTLKLHLFMLDLVGSPEVIIFTKSIPHSLNLCTTSCKWECNSY